MALLPKEIEKKLPPLCATEYHPDPIAYVKFFSPTSNWQWYATEYDPNQRLFFGLVIGFEEEMGYFYLDELEQTRDALGLGIERDFNFTPRPLSKCNPEK